MPRYQVKKSRCTALSLFFFFSLPPLERGSSEPSREANAGTSCKKPSRVFRLGTAVAPTARYCNFARPALRRVIQVPSAEASEPLSTEGGNERSIRTRYKRPPANLHSTPYTVIAPSWPSHQRKKRGQRW